MLIKQTIVHLFSVLVFCFNFKYNRSFLSVKNIDIMFSSILILSVFILSIFLWFLNVRKLPPGPMKLPFVGSIPFLSHKNGILDWVLDPAVTANKLSMIQLGARKLNVINDYELAKVKEPKLNSKFNT